MSIRDKWITELCQKKGAHRLKLGMALQHRPLLFCYEPNLRECFCHRTRQLEEL